MKHLSDFRRAVTPALWAALWGFLGPAALLLADAVQQVAKWASTSGREPLPGLSVFGYGVVAALCSAATGLVAFVFRYAQAKGVVAGEPPKYDGAPLGERGSVSLSEVCLVVVVVILVLWAVGEVPR